MEPDKRLKRGVTASQVIKILKENDIEIDEKEAEVILDFMYFLAKLTVDQFTNEDCGEQEKP